MLLLDVVQGAPRHNHKGKVGCLVSKIPIPGLPQTEVSSITNNHRQQYRYLVLFHY